MSIFSAVIYVSDQSSTEEENVNGFGADREANDGWNCEDNNSSSFDLPRSTSSFFKLINYSSS